MEVIQQKPYALKSIKIQKYLKCEKGVLVFCNDPCHPNFQTEKAITPGCVHIKCLTNGKFWRRAPNQDDQPLKIVAIADKPNENIMDEGCTLFKEVDVGPNIETEVGPNGKIGEICRIIHVQSRLYTRPHYIIGEDPILCAVKPHPDHSGMDIFEKV